LAIQKKTPGPEHPDLARSLNGNGETVCSPRPLQIAHRVDLFCTLPDPKIDALEVQLIGRAA
jgi:hypothetical protein